jgi:type IV pilus assembly protein PilY1
VGALLVANPLTDRKLYAATGTDGALELLTADNVDAEAFGLPSGDPALYTMWQVTGQTDLVKTLKWAWGYDVDDDDGDGNVNETRSWILPDILHSKPLVVNYGALGSFDKTNPDLRIITGTNGGFVHMFSNATGRELWAYLPLDLAPVISKRRKNSTFGRNVYGVDAPVTVYTIDNNYDGTINAAANVAEDDNNEDKAYLYFGLRRGGKSLHALDISDPDDPKFMWAVNNGSTGLSELGQTWSVPKVARIPGYKDGDGNHKLVLILGAGFDTGKDATGVVTPDSEGRGVFILDALTGALVWSVTPAANSATNLQETGLVHSVAADVTPLDSSGDGLIDRIYFPDTGGNVWRIDLPGDELPDDQQTKWHLVKMFSANGGTPATDRRFFNAIDMVRARENGTPVDILLLGSGDRTNPAHTGDPNDVNDPAVDNQFYMIRDMQTIPYKAKFDVARCTEEGYVDFRCAMPLSPVALYNATAQPFDGSGDTDEQAAYTALAAKFGWYLDLEHGAEKSLSASTTLGGKVYFTTFSPEVDDNDEYQCGFSAGKARLEVVSLINGDRDDTLSAVLGGLIPDTVSLHFGSDGRIRTLTPPADGGGSGGGGGGGGGGPCNPCDVDITTPIPYGNFWNSEDYQ